MNNPLISIIIPVYKAEDYLDECISSVVGQSYNHLEIILVDDGSPDNSPVICDNWAKMDSRIRVIHKKNGGASSARNVGIENAHGDFIGFVDSDDFFDKRMYEKLYEGITRSSNIGMSGIKYWRYENGEISVYNSIWDTKKDVLIKAKDYGLLALEKKICHAAANKLYKRCIFDKLRFREGQFNEDVLFSHDLGKVLVEQNLDLLDLDFYAYYYRIHPGSLCRSEIPIDFNYIQNLQEIIDEEKEDSIYKKTAYKLYYHTLYDTYYSLLNDCTAEGKRLVKVFNDMFRDQIKKLTFTDIKYKETESSIYARLSFYVTKYCPWLYVSIKKMPHTYIIVCI